MQKKGCSMRNIFRTSLARARQWIKFLLGKYMKGSFMKRQTKKSRPQPEAFTPGVTKAMVREHAYKLFPDKLHDHPLTTEDWVLAEKDLVQTMEADELQRR